MQSGAWETPLGEMHIDEELSSALIAADPYLENDVEAHRFEHSLEVQLPFLQHLGGPSTQFVPITIGTGSWERLEELGRAIAETLKKIGQAVLIIASSDMNHYESDARTRVKDRKAIDQVLAMDPKGLYEVVRREDISMCGYGPASVTLTATKLLGATRAELVKYATSAEVSQDYDRVVGYAGIVIT
jgi:AmmeMemoRadiSam system protein B